MDIIRLAPREGDYAKELLVPHRALHDVALGRRHGQPNDRTDLVADRFCWEGHNSTKRQTDGWGDHVSSERAAFVPPNNRDADKNGEIPLVNSSGTACDVSPYIPWDSLTLRRFFK